MPWAPWAPCRAPQGAAGGIAPPAAMLRPRPAPPAAVSPEVRLLPAPGGFSARPRLPFCCCCCWRGEKKRISASHAARLLSGVLLESAVTPPGPAEPHAAPSSLLLLLRRLLAQHRLRGRLLRSLRPSHTVMPRRALCCSGDSSGQRCCWPL